MVRDSVFLCALLIGSCLACACAEVSTRSTSASTCHGTCIREKVSDTSILLQSAVGVHFQEEVGLADAAEVVDGTNEEAEEDQEDEDDDDIEAAYKTLMKRKRKNKIAAYSKHDCRGTPFITEGLGLHPNRTCRFQDICYDLTSDSGTLVYFHNGSAKMEELDKSHFYTAPRFPNNADVPAYLDLRPASARGHGPVPMELRLIAGSIPPQAAYFRNPVAALFQPYGAENFGHELGDDMYGIYMMLQIFNIADPFSTQLLTYGSCDSFSDDGMNRSVCKKLIPRMYVALSRYSVLRMRTSDLLQANSGPNEPPQNGSNLMCFRTLLVSPGANSFRMFSRTTVPHHYWGFRSKLVYNMLGPSCADVACNATTSVPRRIVILQKSWINRANSQFSTGDGLENVDALRGHLTARFTAYRVDVADPAALSFKDQISMIMQSASLFSHGGGGGMVAMFLPRNATFAVAGAMAGELEWYSTLWFFTCPLTSKNVNLDLAANIVKAPQPNCSKPFLDV